MVKSIVLIRPTVLPTPEIAALNAQKEKTSLPLVMEAEKAEQKAEDARLRRLNESHVFMELEPKP